MLGLSQALLGRVETVLVSFSEEGLNQSFLGKVRDAGFTGIGLEHDTPRLIAAYREISRLIRQHSIDILVCHGYKAGVVGWCAARKARIPTIAVSRGWTHENWKIRLYEKLDRWMLKRMNSVVCVSQSQADKVAASGVHLDCIEVIHNSISPERFKNRDPAYRTRLLNFFPLSARSQIKYVVGAAGRLSPEKGFDVLIAAAKRVVEQRNDMGFVLFGEGALREALSGQIWALEMEDRFVLAGFCDEIDQLMPHCELFVQSSHTEGLPNVLLEAAAAGLPVVATDVGGTGEVLVDGRTGSIVPPGDPDKLGDAILSLTSNPTLCDLMSHEGKRRIIEKFSFDEQARRYSALFCSLKSNDTSFCTVPNV